MAGINDISYQIIGAAIEVQRHLGGPGLLESVYESALCHELTLRGLRCQRQVRVPVLYKQTVIRSPMIIDVLVEEEVIGEVKATAQEHLSYLIWRLQKA